MTAGANKFKEFESVMRDGVHEAIATIVGAAHAKILTLTQLDALKQELIAAYPAVFSNAQEASGQGEVADPGYGAAFDLTEEVNSQIRAVRALRDMVLDSSSGALKQGRTARDAKELISSSTTLLSSLMKFHDKIINHERLRAIEAATVESIKTLPDAQQQAFFETLELALERIK